MRWTELAYAIHVAFDKKNWPVPHHLKHHYWMNVK